MNERREEARRELLAELDSVKTQAERNRLGQFATPFELASEIVHQAVSMLPPRAEIRFLEPGFGTGPFYSALINSVFTGRVRLACGFEMDAHYGEAATRLWQGTDLQLTIGDFTQTEPPGREEGKFNLVICNPPYVRHHHLSQTQKQQLRSAIARYIGFKLNGLSGLYTFFLLLSQRWMSEGGVGAWLIPSEFMDVNYGRQVKRFLLEKVTLHKIHRCAPQEVQFDDALVSSAIVFFTNSPPPKNHRVKFSLGGSLDKPKLSEEINAERLRDLLKWTSLPRNGSRLLSRYSDRDTLASLFTIKRGLATGCNRFFILTPDQIEGHQIPQDLLIPILPSPRELETSEVMADRNGIPQIKNQLFLLSCDLSEEEIRSRYPSVWRYLERGVAEGVSERYLCRHRSPWYSQEVRPAAALLCTYMGRPTQRHDVPFRFILNHSQATAANVYLLLYPKPALDSFLKSKPALLKEMWKALSAFTADVLIGEGRTYGGGLHKLEPKELGRVPAETIVEILSAEADFRMEKQLSLFGGLVLDEGAA